jgi:hypothetical protein
MAFLNPHLTQFTWVSLQPFTTQGTQQNIPVNKNRQVPHAQETFPGVNFIGPTV